MEPLAKKTTMTEAELDAMLAAMTPAQAQEAIREIESLKKKHEESMLDNYVPQAHQIPIHADKRKIVTVMGGNRSGKSHCCGFTIACHAMGSYPDWWDGVKFNSPLDIGVISITQEQLRKSAQVKLMGEPYALGTGFIPKEAIHDYAWRKGSNGCLDWVLIRHASGGLTRINFMTCEMGQRVFMGFSWDYAWYDEEPELDVFNEIQMRLVDKKGYSLLSFYPYKGESELIQKLDRMPEEFCGHYQLAMSDNTTLDPEEIRMHELTMPEWEKESRMYGRPGAGEGRIFQFSRDDYVIDPFDVEESWGVICGLDVGFGHATAAVAVAYDPMADCAYVFREYVNKQSLPNVHASALRKWGDVDFRIDTSAHRMAPTDGKSLWDMYRDEGLNIYDAETRSGSLMASINKINVMLSEKRLYIFSSCRELIREMGLYRTSRNTKTGEVKVVKKDQDCVDAFRYAVMWLESSRVRGVNKIKPMPKIVSWEPFDKRIGI